MSLCLSKPLKLSDDQTKFGLCLSGLHTTLDNFLNHTADGLDGDKSSLDNLEFFFRDWAEAIDNYQTCQEVELMDFLQWLDQHLNQKQSDCLSSGISLYMAIQTFNAAPKHLEAFPTLLRATDTTLNTCALVF